MKTIEITQMDGHKATVDASAIRAVEDLDGVPGATEGPKSGIHLHQFLCYSSRTPYEEMRRKWLVARGDLPPYNRADDGERTT